MQPTLEPQVIDSLNMDIKEESLKSDAKLMGRERASRRIKMIMQGTARRLNLDGEVKMFGSFSNGFKTGSSDLDVVFVGKVGPDKTIPILGKFASMVQEFGFENVTKIFQANVPLVKFTDIYSQMEVDFCINNELGVRNSQLLYAYCNFDDRVLQLGRLVKDWAKRHELVGTADGCLNSYAYMLLVIHFLQSVQPPVVPNLQAQATEPVTVADNKWGGEDYWDTKFVEDVASLPRSANTMSTGELLVGFYHFFTCVFDWHMHAVCMRLNGPDVVVDKYSLKTPTNDEQWYIEDPFDLKHNLAGKCTRAGRKRILDEMRDALKVLTAGGTWAQACPALKADSFFLKCRISQGVTPHALLEEFEEFDLVKLHFPKPDSSGRMGQAFLEFSSASARRRAHTRNESYVADCQLQLHYSSQHSLAEALSQGVFSTYDMASYKMQRQVLAARMHNLPMMMQQQHHHQQQRPDMPRGLMQQAFQDGGQAPPGSLLGCDAGPYGFPYGGPARPQQQQGGPPQQPGPGTNGSQAHAWDPQAAGVGVAKQFAQAEAALQQRKASPEQLIAKSAPRPEARAKAGEPKPAAVPPKAAAAQRPQPPISARGAAQAVLAKPVGPKAASGNGHLQAPAVADALEGCWLGVRVEYSEDVAPLLSSAEKETVQAFLRSWGPCKPGSGQIQDEGTIHVEVQAPLQQAPLLSSEEWKKIRHITSWLDRCKAG